MLNGGAVQTGADLGQQPLALAAVVAEDPYLDQFVRQQVDVYLVQNRGRQPMLADADERVQVMGLRAEGSPCRGC